MEKGNCGEIILRDVGIPKEVDERTGPGELLLYPKWNSEKHKGQNGRVAIVGGGPFQGAPALAGLGSYRGGADLVHVFVPESSYESVSSFIPELIVHSCPGDVIDETCINQIKSLSINFDSYVIGPGIGQNSSTIEAIQMMINHFDNIVLDADAIQKYDFSGNILVTPHTGEIERLISDCNDKNLMSFAKEHSLAVLLKGKTDVITNGDKIFIELFKDHPTLKPILYSLSKTASLYHRYCSIVGLEWSIANKCIKINEQCEVYLEGMAPKSIVAGVICYVVKEQLKLKKPTKSEISKKIGICTPTINKAIDIIKKVL